MSTNKPKFKKYEVAEPRLSMAMENYLISIFHLHEQGTKSTLSRLAEQIKRLPEGEGIGTSLPSVGGMVSRMVREGLVNKSPQKNIALTSKGLEYAEGIVRRHRLAECMVVDLLGLELHASHVEAHRLEHAISQELEDKIKIRLGNPLTCPFGHPIPGSGYVAAKDAIPLSQAAEGQTFVVDRVPEDDQQFLEYLVVNRIIPGRTVVVEETASYRGVIIISSQDNEIVIGYAVADRLWVKPEQDV